LHADITDKERFVSKWVKSHIEDGEKILKKPVLFTEFGLSNEARGYDHSHRLIFYKSIFDIIYESARKNGAGSGAFVWQLMVEGMEAYHDSFAFIPENIPLLHSLLKEQSCRLAGLRYGSNLVKQTFKNICE
jgi:mannan endo-1,4-beta-mannosidase